MLRSLFLFHAISVVCCTTVRAQHTIYIEQQGDSLYLACACQDSATRTEKGKANIVCNIPRSGGRLVSVFADGDEHVSNAGSDLRHAAFTVLLQGETRARIGARERVSGDTVLLRKLISKDLVKFSFTPADLWSVCGEGVIKFEAVVLKVSPVDVAEIRRRLREKK